MRAFLLFSAMAVCVLAACKKFDHTTSIPGSCELCAYADELEGVYYGKASGLAVNSATGSFTDSLKITVEHIFLSHGAYVDSTVMYLKLTTKYQSMEDSTTRIIEMHGKDSYTYFNEGDHYSEFSMTPDSIRIDITAPPTAPGTPTELLHYLGIKQ